MFFFSKTPHKCVLNGQCNEGIILRYVYWGTQDPSLASPTPTPTPQLQGAKMFGGGLVLWASPGQDVAMHAQT